MNTKIKLSEIKKAWKDAGHDPLVLTAEQMEEFALFAIKYMKENE